VAADVAYIDAGETLRRAGHLMRELGVGVLVVRGENGQIQGTISRDMVVRRIAAGDDPRTVAVGEVASRRRRSRRDQVAATPPSCIGASAMTPTRPPAKEIVRPN
jgi:CBS domain-containing protein